MMILRSNGCLLTVSHILQVKLNIIMKIVDAKDVYDHLSALEMELLQSYGGYHPEKGAESQQYQ